jgi:hypothetical protein
MCYEYTPMNWICNCEEGYIYPQGESCPFCHARVMIRHCSQCGDLFDFVSNGNTSRTRCFTCNPGDNSLAEEENAV